ncbi:MAG: DUF433 domain-containing protein [Gemmatimonadota bacterium]
MSSVRDHAIQALAVDRDPEVHSGDLVFRGTRVPVATLTDIIRAGGTLDEFLEGYPTVERWQADSFLEMSPEAVEKFTREARAHSHR